jgi:GWxTD domain-containing protein
MMTETDLDREFASARYIALEDEMSQYESLKSLEAKRKFVFEFWKRRDRTPGTPENETKQEYAKRVEYSNQNFHTGMREGWRTDRGRVWIIYGQPDEIERHANEIDTRPYEIWYYHGIEGGVLFAFVDKSGFSDYILVHSTHRNELRDDDWQRQIKTN